MLHSNMFSQYFWIYMRLHELSRFAYLRVICILAPSILSCIIFRNIYVQMFSTRWKIYHIFYKASVFLLLNTSNIYSLCNILSLVFCEYVQCDHTLRLQNFFLPFSFTFLSAPLPLSALYHSGKCLSSANLMKFR